MNVGTACSALVCLGCNKKKMLRVLTSLVKVVRDTVINLLILNSFSDCSFSVAEKKGT